MCLSARVSVGVCACVCVLGPYLVGPHCSRTRWTLTQGDCSIMRAKPLSGSPVARAPSLIEASGNICTFIH